ncbi:MAG: multidrug effflux MFS transporter [Neptuniibacter sp.]
MLSVERLRRVESISLIACIMCMTALSIDIVLPVLGVLRQELTPFDANNAQLVISFVFVGLSFGLIFYGPLSDSQGRKKTIYFGFVIFVTGCVVSAVAPTIEVMLLGRFLQGLGAAAPRIVCIALIRDQYKGPEMARFVSLVMTIFMLCPLFAPLLGQFLSSLMHWRGIFVFLGLFALLACLWFAVRQDETLLIKDRKPFSFKSFVRGMREVVGARFTFTYVICLGLVFGGFIGFLSTSQQLMEESYQLKEAFPLHFALLAFAMGIASFINSKLVTRFSLRSLVVCSLLIYFLFSIFILIFSLGSNELPHYPIFVVYMGIVLFCTGLLFSNINSLAMQPFGHIAGLAASCVSTMSTLLAVIIGMIIGRAFDGTPLPLITGFVLCGGLSLILVILPSVLSCD